MNNLTVSQGTMKQLYLPAFTWNLNCSSTIVYNASLDNGFPLPSFLMFDEVTMKIEIINPTMFDQGNYSIRFYGTLPENLQLNYTYVTWYLEVTSNQ